MRTITITGHRKLLNEKAVRREIALSLAYFAEQQEPIQALSALAGGADTIFAEEALAIKASLRVILPFNLDEYQKDFSEAEQVELDKLVKKGAHPYEVVTKLKTHTDEERNQAYLATGKKLVDEADVVLAVWDGQPAQGVGGTGDIVEYARQQGKELHIIKGIREGKNPKDTVQTTFDSLDAEAIKYKKHRFERVWWVGLGCAVAAVFCFACGLVLHERFSPDVRFVLALMEGILILISAIALLGVAKKWKDQFLALRRDAEYLRSVLWYREAGIPIPIIEQAKYERLKYKTSKRILAIEQEVATGIIAINNFPNAKRKAWSLAEDQIMYHEHTRIGTFEKHEKRLEVFLRIIKYAFFTSVGVKFIAELQEYLAHKDTHLPLPELHSAMPFLNVLVIVLPPMYAALEGVKFFGEWKHNITISSNIITQLKTCKNRIMACQNEQTLLVETAQLRYILEIENSDWATQYEQKVVEVPV